MSLSVLHYLCLVTLLSHNLASCTITDDEEPRRTFPFRRAIDGTRGRKFYEPEDDGFLHGYGSSGHYDPDDQVDDFSDIRNNIPGEPGIDYPAYTRLPQTGFVCEADFRGYYADEEVGCQVFHVCDGSFLVSSFLCPMGAIFSQKLLTCDWWAKVDCSATRNYHVINTESLVSEADDDEILRKAFEMSSVQSSGERIPPETVNEQQEPETQQRKFRVLNYGTSPVTERTNDLQTGSEKYSDYPDYSSRKQPRFQSRTSQKNRQRHQEDDYYSENVEEEGTKQLNNSPVRVHTIGEDRRNDRTFGNEFQPSYAPTVPTVITTTRRFYSPTFPTTYKPERDSRRRFDLEFESSDHLYNARGRSDETIKAATVPSVVSKITTSSKDISLPMLINNADERRYEVENMQESESSYYKTDVTISPLKLNTIKVRSSTEATISKDLTDNNGKITETFSILTIDNDNRNPDTFAYIPEKAPISINVTNVESTSKFAKENSTITVSLGADKKAERIAAFLQPPQKVKKPFQIRVSGETIIAGHHHQASKTKKLDKSYSHSNVEVIPSIEVPAFGITPPFYNGKAATRESRIIRIFADKKNSSSDDVSSIKPVTEKLEADDSIPPVEDSEGQHSETKIIAEKLPGEQEGVVKKINKNQNSTSSAKIQSSEKVSANKAKSTSSELDESHLIDLINAAVALEESRFTITTEDSVEPSSSVLKKKASDIPKTEKSFTNSNISEEKNYEAEEKQNGTNKKLSAETKISQLKNDEQLSGGEKLLLGTKMLVAEEEKSVDLKKSKVDLLDSKARVSNSDNGADYRNPNNSNETLREGATVLQEKNHKNLDENKSTLLETERSVGDEKKTVEQTLPEEILLTAATTVPEEKNSESDKKISDNDETVPGKTTVSQEKSIELSIDDQEVLKDAKTPVTQDKNNADHEKSEKTQLDTKTTVPETKNSSKVQKPNDNDKTLGEKITVSQEKSIELSIVSEPITFDPKTIDPKNKITEYHGDPIDNEKTLNGTKNSNAKISEDQEHSIDSKGTLLTAKPTVFEAKDSGNHERPSRSDETEKIEANIADSIVEGSSPLQVTLTVNKDEQFDPSGEVIRKLIANQEIGDSVAAGDYRSFEIVKSDQPGASKDQPHDSITAADSRSGRRIALERNISDEKRPNFRSNDLQSGDYYKNLVGLVNGPNQPRPFSLGSPQNVEVRTLSDSGGAVPSISAPFIPGTIRNDLEPPTTRLPVQKTPQSTASSVQASAPQEKLSSSTTIELSNEKKVLDQLGQTFGERLSKGNDEKLILELPQEQRSLDFKTGKHLGNSQQVNAQVDDQSEESRTTQRSIDSVFSRTIVETEFIPSISFSLNTEEERGEYMEAVMKGLLSDIQTTESTNNDTNTSLES